MTDGSKGFAKNSFWSLAGFGGSQIIRFIANWAVTRVLEPRDFGLLALAGILIQALELFSDVGVAPSVIRSARGDEPAFLRTAWTIQFLRSIVLFVLSAALAYPFSILYGDPRLITLIPLVSGNFIFAGLVSPGVILAQRHLQVRTITILDLSAACIGAATMTLAAYAGLGYWALGIGPVTIHASKALLSYLLTRGPRPLIVLEPAARREILDFGRWIFISTSLTFVTMHSDRLVFGKLMSLDSLGLYNLAAQLGAMPALALGHLAHQVVFPIYSKILVAKEDLAPTFRRTRQMISLAALFAFVMLIAAGPSLLRTIYRQQFHQAAFLLPAIAVAGWITVLDSSMNAALYADGRAKDALRGAIAKAILMIPMMVLGFQLGGVVGAVWALAAAECIRYLGTYSSVRRMSLPTLKTDALLTMVLLVLGFGIQFVAENLPGIEGHGRLQHASRFAVAGFLVVLMLGYPTLRAVRAMKHMRKSA